eukprot:7472623-Pyramimonas_sp.AAC.1
MDQSDTGCGSLFSRWNHRSACLHDAEGLAGAHDQLGREQRQLGARQPKLAHVVASAPVQLQPVRHHQRGRRPGHRQPHLRDALTKVKP